MRILLCYLLLAALVGCSATSGIGGTSLVGQSSTSGSTDSLKADTAADVAAIDALYAGWRVAVEAADIDAYVDVLHPDIRMFLPGADIVAGSGSYAAFLEPVFAGATYKIDVLQMPQTTVLGDLAVTEYIYVVNLQLKNDQEGIAEPGALTANRSVVRYFDVLRRREDGRWGIWRHTWSNPPAADPS